MDPSSNDTEAIFHELHREGATIEELFSKIRGEYAFIILDVENPHFFQFDNLDSSKEALLWEGLFW